jgi:acetyl-CoA C-acetyltransferase
MTAPPRFDPRQPVLVGIGTCMQREERPADAREPMDLMLEAVRRAGADAGGAQALAGVGRIAVPQGRWRYRNPAGEIARAVGAAAAVTVLAEVGVLQQTLIGDACARIAAGEIDSALIAGADAGYRILRARQAGERGAERQQDDAPDVHLAPQQALLHEAELRAGIRMPAALYAILESAWRARQGWTVGEHRQRLGALYRRFSEIAADNPDAWRRKALGADEIATASARNPMQAFPYTRLHCATWNVDQAAALLLCSAGKAAALGIPRAKWVYARSSAECNHMTPMSARGELAGCTGARLAGRAALAAAGIDVAQVDLAELYSCFPIAVEIYAEELGLAPTRDLTVTGGMPFAGGPFNNYVLQATCRMGTLIRAGAGRNGLVSSVSGILTKQGFGLWSDAPGAAAFAAADVTADCARLMVAKDVTDTHHGRAAVAGCTVVHEAGQAPRALVLADTESGGRALAWSADPALVERIESVEFCGEKIAIAGTVFSFASA